MSQQIENMDEHQLLPPVMPSDDVPFAGKGTEPTSPVQEFPPVMPLGYDSGTTAVITRQSASTPPDVAAADMLLADRVGAPAELVSRNREYFRDMDVARQVNEVLSGAPAVRGVYNQSPLTASLLRDDLGNAAELEKLLTGYQPPLAQSHASTLAPRLKYSNEGASPTEAQQIHGYQLSALERLPVAAMEGMAALAENGLSFLSGLSNTYTPTAQDIEQYLPGEGQAAIDALKAGMESQPLAGGLERVLKDYHQRAQATALKPTGNVVQDFVEDVVRMGPQMVAQLSTYAAGGFIPSMLFMGTQIAGGQYAQLTEDEAQDKARAFLASLANAGLQAPLESLAAGKVLDIFKGTGLAQVFKAGASSMLTEFVTETVQKYPDALTTLWAEAEHKGRDGGDTMRYFFDHIWQYTKEGAYEGLVASVYGGLGSAGKVAHEYGRYQAGQTDGAFFAALDDSAKGSKTRERLPQEYQKVVEAVSAGGPVENVYVAPQALREAAGDDATFYQLAEKVGLSQDTITRAEELGADLEIPLPLYQTHIAGTDTSLAMRDSVKLRPDDMTLAERLSFEREAPAQLADALRRMEADSTANAELDAALAPVAERLGTVYGKEATQTNIDLLKARAVIAADWWTQAGEPLTPAQVVTDKWGLTLEVLGLEGANTGADLMQASKPEITRRFGIMQPIAMTGQEIDLAWDDLSALRKQLPRWAEEHGITGTFQNSDTGWDVIVSPKGIKQTVAHGGKEDKLRSVAGIPAFIQGGMLVHSADERSGKPMTDHIFATKANIGGKDFVVGYVVKEDVNGNRYYDHEMTEIIDPAELQSTSGAASHGEVGRPKAPQGRVLNILREVLGVNDGTASVFFQDATSTPRGSVSFTDSGAVIRLFRDSADLSTFVHESAHLFLRDMQALVATGNAPRQVVEDMEKLKAFTAEYDDAATLQSFYEQAFQPVRTSFAGKDFAALTPDELAQVRDVAQQEKLADAFLTYLREGRAPSPELRSAFRRFKDWLKGLYQSVMGNVQINEDVRGVFDRMLATEADMALVESLHQQEAANASAASNAGYTVLWENLTDAEARQLREAQREAGAQSREARLSTSLRSYMDSLLGKKEATARAQKDIAARPVYAAMDLALTEGGLSRESVAAEFGEDTVAALNKKQRGLVKKSGGLNVYDLAMACDFASAEDMVLAMLEAEPKSKAVSAMVKEELAQREAALRQDLESGREQEARAGEEDYYNDSRLAALLLELRAVERKTGRKVGANAGTAGRSRQWARDILGAMPVRDALHVGRHAAAEARAAAQAAQALAEGRAEDAAAAKRRQVINHAMVLEALELRKKQDSLHKALRRWEKSKSMDFVCREQIMALAQRYSVGGNIRKGISRFAPAKPDELQNLGAFMEALTADDTFGMPPFSDFLLTESVPAPMSMEQMQEVWDAMRWLAAQGSPGEAQLIAEGVSGSVKAAAEEGAAVLAASGNVAKVHEEGTAARSFSDKWRHIFASLNEFKDMMLRADGYQEIGPQGSHRKGFHSQWFQRLKEANDELSRIYRQEVMPEQRRIEVVRYDFIKRFNELYGKPLGKRAASINGIEPPQNMKDVGRSAWTAEHIWCLARNMGNAGNLKTLHEGYGLSMDDLRSLTSILTAKEWQAVQAEGNLVGGFYERTDTVFRKVYGRPMPDKVQPQELEVMAADGQALTLPGWYFPIAVDGKLDPDVKDKGQVDMIQADPKFAAFGPSLARNHTKGRSGTGKPVGLYFDVFERALQDQLRFMTHAPALKDFDRITRNPQWRKAYVTAFGQQAYDQLRPTLKYLARPYGESQGALEGWIARSRQLATLYILGHNVKTFVRQFQGLSPAQTELGGGWIARGMGRVYRSPLAAVDAINELSPFMADRQKGYDRELRQALRGYKARVQVKVRGKLYTEQDVQNFTMGLITVGDCATVYPIWQGAYIKAQDALGMGQKEAVAFADSIVQKTNASASPIDLTPLQQKDGLWRLFTMFMGEGLRKGSRMRYWWGALQAGKIDMFQYSRHLALESIVPALSFVALVGLLSDDEPDKEDFALAVTSELIGPYPFLSALPGALQYNKPLMQSPVFTGVEAAAKAVKSTKGIWDSPNDPEAWARFYKSAFDVAFFMAGVGNGRRLYETWGEGWEDLQFGRTHNPFRLVFRKPRE